ncbi:hypothetical protein A2U01_0046594, partial [Trifolium medium]|nr:hypothetical protein [Trifolium medium]
ANMIDNSSWIFPSCIAELDMDVVACINIVVLPKRPLDDRLVWVDAKDGY